MNRMSASNPPLRTSRPEAEQIGALTTRLRVPGPVRVVKAPLRICPLGAHIDHQLGVVTGMTIDRAIFLAFVPASGGAVRVESLNFTPPVSFSLDDIPPPRRGDWGNYLRGAARALQGQHRLERGLTGVVGGDMPVGGLSSSAAVTIAYLLALEAANGLNVPPAENVSLVRRTENDYIGLNNGVLDQSVILVSEPRSLTVIDCDSLRVERVPSPPAMGDFEIMVVYSGMSRGLVGTDYNSRVAECREAARQLLRYAGKPDAPDAPLRRVSAAIFEAEGHRLPPALHRRASHYFGEMRRVTEGVSAWRAGDVNRFGALMNESGQSSIKNFESGSPQLITLYETLRDTPGVYGARFSGGGFGGSCIALIDPPAREAVAAAVHRRYPAAHPEQARAYSIHLCKPGSRAEVRAEQAGC